MMDPQDTLSFVQQRLRRRAEPAWTFLTPRSRITRRLPLQLPRGEAHTLDCVDEGVVVRCLGGSLWITHDGDCKDVILHAGQAYRVQRAQPMHLFMLADSVLEIEFQDDRAHDA